MLIEVYWARYNQLVELKEEAARKEAEEETKEDPPVDSEIVS